MDDYAISINGERGTVNRTNFSVNRGSKALLDGNADLRADILDLHNVDAMGNSNI